MTEARTDVAPIEHLDWTPGCEYSDCDAAAEVAATLHIPCCGPVTKFLCGPHLEAVIVDGHARDGRPVLCRKCGTVGVFRWQPGLLSWEPIGGHR